MGTVRKWSAALGIVVIANGCSPGLKSFKHGKSRSSGSNQPAAVAADGSLYAGLRRLSRDELDRTLEIVIEDFSRPATRILPEDAVQPFDNQVLAQVPSRSLIQGLDAMAEDVASRLLADSARRNRVVGCAGAAPGDRSCLESVVSKLGRRFFRRPLTPDELQSLTTFASVAAMEESSFDSGVSALLRVLAQDPRFLYRLEEADGFSTVRAFRMASKLAFTLWGSGPDESLLSLAANGQLATRDQVRATALTMLQSPLAQRQASRFHAMWLRYQTLGVQPALQQAMNDEASAMVTRVLFTESRPWIALLSSSKTEITSTMGEIYGINGLGSGAPTLVDMPSGRKGLLGTPAVLAVASKFGDTSPTQRGKFIREALLCQPVPPPPPGVNADAPPEAPAGGRNCKSDRYASHRMIGSSCFACHNAMDPIGFGLEQFDRFGRQRAFEPLPAGGDDPNCPIGGDGEVVGLGSFRGPAELADLLIASRDVESCLVQNVLSFAVGRPVASADYRFIDQIRSQFSGGTYQQLVLSLVTSQAFFGE